MIDALLVIAMVASFVALAGFVAVCARVIGPDPEGVVLSDRSGADEHAVEAAA
jgi:hypothetical protein